jgi:Acyl CoA:acetate/3-ketoacid CoA transferase, alpha subunit
VKNKVITVERAVEMIPDGAVLMIGGFLGDGTPELLIDALVKSGKRTSPSLLMIQPFQTKALGR